MALQAYPHSHLPQLQLPSSCSCPPRLTLSPRPPNTFNPHHPFTLTFPIPPIGITPLPQKQSRRSSPVATVVEESQESSEPEAEAVSKPEEQEPTAAQSELASELKKAMQERKDKEEEEDSLWSGVAREVGEIEWPSFGKVLGTTGVVLSVIFGSSVVLLTVNAVLAELSDKLFAGKGVQDFFT